MKNIKNKKSILPQPQQSIYPCSMCGKLRTKDEGGTTFTVCDECWEKIHKPQQKFCKCEKPQKNIRFDYCDVCSKYLPPHPEANLELDIIREKIATPIRIECKVSWECALRVADLIISLSLRNLEVVGKEGKIGEKKELSPKAKIIDLLIGASIIGHRYQQRKEYEKLADEIIEQVRKEKK